MSQDAASTEIFANLFKAVVDEMAWILLRSSHTTFVKETQDFAVALVTPEGETFAYPYGSGATPIMGVPMHAGTQAVNDWAPGDVLITNDPYSTGGMVMHLNDIYLFQPIFADGALLCFAWSFIHCTDVGGYAPGSIDMQNNEVFQEGLRLRPMRLYRGGELNTELWNIFADNCRIPALNWGDIDRLRRRAGQGRATHAAPGATLWPRRGGGGDRRHARPHRADHPRRARAHPRRRIPLHRVLRGRLHQRPAGAHRTEADRRMATDA